MLCSVEDHVSGYFCKRHIEFEEKVNVEIVITAFMFLTVVQNYLME
jgi:hypothetical protein